MSGNPETKVKSKGKTGGQAMEATAQAMPSFPRYSVRKILQIFGLDMAMRSECGVKIFKAAGPVVVKPVLVDLMRELLFAS